MILAFDTSSAACTAALFDDEGRLLDSRDEQIGRGHAERLVPMLADLLDGRQAESIIVGVGPGSFTGIRVAVAAAHGLAIGWDAQVRGMDSLALIAAGVAIDEPVAAAVLGGHGEIFIREFDGRTAEPLGPLHNLSPGAAARIVRVPTVIGSAAQAFIDARGDGEASEAWPCARNTLRIPGPLRSLPARPTYARAPDAKVRQPARAVG